MYLKQRSIVLLSFPFTDLSSSKVRPVIVISNERYNRDSEDFIAVPLTSNLREHEYSILVTQKDLETGKLILDSMARIDRVSSISKNLVRMNIGSVKTHVHKKIVGTLTQIIRSG
jgi:mRNA interferase MazF